jgi:hypothetical protein
LSARISDLAALADTAIHHRDPATASRVLVETEAADGTKVELIAGQRLVMRTAQRQFPMKTTYTGEPVGGGRTRMMLRNRGERAGFGKVTAPSWPPRCAA